MFSSDDLKKTLDLRLTSNDSSAGDISNPIPVTFPPCSDLILSQVGSPDRLLPQDNSGKEDEIQEHFNDYFNFHLHRVWEGEAKPNLAISDCLDNVFGPDVVTSHNLPTSCTPMSCVTLSGKRNLEKGADERVKRLFIGDLVWVFYFERMGIFKIIGALLDDFATNGKYPLANDTETAIIMEAMVRLTKKGLASSVRDRDSTYRRSLGWTSDVGRKLGSNAAINRAFNSLFHKFIQSSLQYYKEKRLAAAIQSTNLPQPSAATLITIGDTISMLKDAFKPFYYGRNYYNTLNGIVWICAGLDLIKRIRSEIGIPNTYSKPTQYVPAAYQLLVEGKPITPSEINRYKLHKECAIDARDILLDIETLKNEDQDFSKSDNELRLWLDLVEDRIEGYRTDYRTLTGIDLGVEQVATEEPKIEQKA